jgi:hypothetical protein
MIRKRFGIFKRFCYNRSGDWFNNRGIGAMVAAITGFSVFGFYSRSWVFSPAPWCLQKVKPFKTPFLECPQFMKQ